jgi:hypothetical protein
MGNPKSPDGKRQAREQSAMTGVPQPPEKRANIRTVLDWVGDDPMRARAAIRAEGQRSGGPRTRLLSQLERMIASGHRI